MASGSMRAEHFSAGGNLKPLGHGLFGFASCDGFRHEARKIAQLTI